MRLGQEELRHGLSGSEVGGVPEALGGAAVLAAAERVLAKGDLPGALDPRIGIGEGRTRQARSLLRRLLRRGFLRGRGNDRRMLRGPRDKSARFSSPSIRRSRRRRSEPGIQAQTL